MKLKDFLKRLAYYDACVDLQDEQKIEKKKPLKEKQSEPNASDKQKKVLHKTVDNLIINDEKKMKLKREAFSRKFEDFLFMIIFFCG
jgi:hypothetical protein